MRTLLRGFAATVMAVVLLAACSGEHGGEEGERVTGQVDPPTTSAPESTNKCAEPDPTPLAITASELDNEQFRFEIPTGAVKEGKVAVTFLNVGSSDHEATFVKITDGDFEKFKSTLDFSGGLAAALQGNEPVAGGTLEAAAKKSDTKTLTLTPGVYAVVSPAIAPDDGKTLAEHGMIRKLTVEPVPPCEPSTASA